MGVATVIMFRRACAGECGEFSDGFPARGKVGEDAPAGMAVDRPEDQFIGLRYVEIFELGARRAAIIGKCVHELDQFGADRAGRAFVSKDLAHFLRVGIHGVARLPGEERATGQDSYDLREDRVVAVPVEIEREEMHARAMVHESCTEWLQFARTGCDNQCRSVGAVDEVLDKRASHALCECVGEGGLQLARWE